MGIHQSKHFNQYHTNMFGMFCVISWAYISIAKKMRRRLCLLKCNVESRSCTLTVK